MKIGEVSRQTGASQKAIRHYENMGLLKDISRRGSYRSYSQQDVQLIRLIRAAQGLGFKLAELVNCIEAGHLPSWQQVLLLVEQKQAAVQQQLNQLTQLSQQLEELRTELQTCLADEGPLDLCEVDCAWMAEQVLASR